MQNKCQAYLNKFVSLIIGQEKERDPIQKECENIKWKTAWELAKLLWVE